MVKTLKTNRLFNHFLLPDSKSIFSYPLLNNEFSTYYLAIGVLDGEEIHARG